MTEALAGAFPGAVVAQAYVADVAVGTNDRAHVRLTYRAGSGPARVFVKREGRWVNRVALSVLGAREAEARLVAHGPLPLETPALFAGAADVRRLAAVVVMEDVTLRGARPGSATVPLTPAQVASGLGGLAALHARHWDRPLPDTLGFVRPWRLGASWAPVAWAGFVHAGGRLRALDRPELMPADPATIERGFRGWARLAAAGPQTLLHGDPHPGNTYALPDGRLGFYDWQLVRSGSWVHDVGYFLVSGLAVDDRRAHERDLLGGYLSALARHGGTAPTFEDAWAAYRRTPVFGLGSWLQTLAGGGFQPVEVCLATLERFAAAYHDLETAVGSPSR